MLRLRSFQTRVERQVLVLVLVFCVLPLVALTWGAVRLIEAQTLSVAERHLGEFSKDFALDLLQRFDVAVWELRHAPQVDPSTAEDWRWVAPLGATPGVPNSGRPSLRPVAGGIELEVPEAEQTRRGFISDAALLAELDNLPFGVRGCVLVDGVVRRCAGPALEGATVDARWTLPLMSLYDTTMALEVRTQQDQRVALAGLGPSYSLLPYTVFAVMTATGWLVLRRLQVRFVPIAELERATRRVADGDYGHRVDIHTGDELQRLGEAFNAMTGQLAEAFDTMRALATMDRMILEETGLDDLVREAMTLLWRLGRHGSAVWLWEPGTGQGSLYRLDPGQRLVRDALDASPPPTRLAEARRQLEERVSLPVEFARPVMCGDSLAGLLAAMPSERLAVAGDVLAEIGDRLSVAATNHDRARALYRQANYDGLTGLLNREAFGHRLSQAIQAGARDGHRGALLCLDLDRFKQVNDTEGHQVGDRLLAGIARRLREALRAADEAARLGGDEFAVLVPRIGDVAEVESLCRRLMETVSRPIDVDGSQLVVEVSIGAVVFPDDGDGVTTLMRKADMAMYKAKEHSGCSFAFFDEVMNRETEQRAQVERRLRQGLKDRALCLHFQPRVRLSDGAVVGLEGLLRWPGESDMHPGVFIPVAEQTGLIHDMNDVLIEDAQGCIRACRSHGFPVERVAINVSPRQFQRDSFAQRFLDTLADRGADPDDFEIEVTESVLIHDRESVSRELESLRQAGVTIALDDFGTGYSSLNVLRELPMDVIKIDRSFVEPITASPQALDLIGRIIDIIRALSLQSVAEGVETERELELLTARGCDQVQGFLFSPALPVAGLIRFLEQRCARSA